MWQEKEIVECIAWQKKHDMVGIKDSALEESIREMGTVA
jgi:hypothetical protein